MTKIISLISNNIKNQTILSSISAVNSKETSVSSLTPNGSPCINDKQSKISESTESTSKFSSQCKSIRKSTKKSYSRYGSQSKKQIINNKREISLRKKNWVTTKVQMRNPNSWGCYTAEFPEEYYKVNIVDAITIQQLVRTFMKKIPWTKLVLLKPAAL